MPAVCVDPAGVVIAADAANALWEMWVVDRDSSSSSSSHEPVEAGTVAVRQVAHVCVCVCV